MTSGRNLLRAGAALTLVFGLSACGTIGGLFGGGDDQQPQATAAPVTQTQTTTDGGFYQDPKAPGGYGM